MIPKTPILVVTHLLALGIAYCVARNMTPPVAPEGAAPVRSKSQTRDRAASSGDGGQLLTGFLMEQKEKKSKYDELKETLPVAKDLKGAVVAAIDALGGSEWAHNLTEEERADRIAEVEVRVLHWMKQNPGEAMDFLLKDPGSNEAGLPYFLRKNVFKEIVSADGVLKSLPWLTTRGTRALPNLCAGAIDEIKAGGGVAFLAKLQAAMEGNDFEATYRTAGVEGTKTRDPFSDGETFLVMAGKSIPFGEKEKLLELAKRQPDAESRAMLLSGFGRSDARAAAWLLDIIAGGELDEDVASQVKGNLGDAVLRAPSMDLEQRVEARRATKGNEVKARESIVDEMVGGDVSNLLEKGRDWRYEFRHGMASVDDVMAAVHIGVPIPAEAEDAVRITLYRHLSEEDPEKALPLLDGLSDDRRRAVLFDFTLNNQGNVSPDNYLRFLADVPEPVTPHENDLQTKAWNFKARECLTRYGEDYVEWVKQMPPGHDKDAAMNSLIQVTRQENPAKARELNDQLFPKKP